MYSSSTILVFTMGDGVNGFTLDPQIGEFVMTHPNIQVPKRGKVRRDVNYVQDPNSAYLDVHPSAWRRVGYARRDPTIVPPWRFLQSFAIVHRHRSLPTHQRLLFVLSVHNMVWVRSVRFFISERRPLPHSARAAAAAAPLSFCEDLLVQRGQLARLAGEPPELRHGPQERKLKGLPLCCVASL